MPTAGYISHFKPEESIEYQEIIQIKYGLPASDTFISLLRELPNVKFCTPFFKWNLITMDPDDNKYVDCALTGGANFIVSEDKHFSILKRIQFPKINVISIDSFMKLLKYEE